MKNKLFVFVSGILIGMAIFTSVVFALGTEKEITVNYLPLKFFFNGVEKVPPSGEEGFVYNGRTYVPLRFMAESMGQPVRWDGGTSSIFIGTEPEKISRLNDIQILSTDSVIPYENFYMAGKKYSYGILSGQESNGSINPYDFGLIDYNLKKEYVTLEGLFGISDSNAISKTRAMIIIMGDDKELYRSSMKAPGDEPEKFTVKVDGVKKLTIKMISDGSSIYAVIAEPKLIRKPD